MPPTLLALAATAFALKGEADRRTTPPFERFELPREFWAEGVDFGDLNHDGEVDVVAVANKRGVHVFRQHGE